MDIILPERYDYATAFLTMRCNLNCSYCLNAFKKDFNRTIFKEISGEKWVEALNRIKFRKGLPITFTGGEPFLHKDFVYIIKNLRKDTEIDILTNLNWGGKGLEKFIREVNPERVKRDAPYASVRVSYHPEQMGNGEELVKNAKKMQDAGFSIGIWAVLYPSSQQLSAINQMQFRCRDSGIDFRLKEFTGVYREELYGDYSRYINPTLQDKTRKVLCRTSELVMGPDGNVYRCHRDLFSEENPVGSILSPEFEIKDMFRRCDKYGQCHPCDVKVKTNHKQQLGHTSVEISEL